ncbi:MAG: DUF6875 domain-containing protein [Candidatus Nanopelagicales bacterium]
MTPYGDTDVLPRLDMVVPGSVVDVDQVRRDPVRFADAARVLAWLDSFVMQPNEGLGRPGHVCPRLKPVVDANRLTFATVATPDAEPATAYRAGLQLADLYRSLYPDVVDHRTAALVAVFPDLPESAAGTFVDDGHKMLRMEFVSSGLMIGEFHPTSGVASVRNDDLHVMQAPMPMYAIRGITPHDIMFLDRPTEDPQRRISYLEHYLHFVGPQLATSARLRVSASLEELKAAAG